MANQKQIDNHMIGPDHSKVLIFRITVVKIQHVSIVMIGPVPDRNKFVGPLLAFSINCVGQSAAWTVKGLFTKSTTIHGPCLFVNCQVTIGKAGNAKFYFCWSL